jgi:hypothetical protein
LKAGVGAALAARVEAVLAELPGVERRLVDDRAGVYVADRLFAIVSPRTLEVLLDPIVAAAAARTPDTRPSERGPGWVRFEPRAAHPFALDRAEAWLRSAHRLASGR